jgi:hypothetical protein
MPKAFAPGGDCRRCGSRAHQPKITCWSRRTSRASASARDGVWSATSRASHWPTAPSTHRPRSRRAAVMCSLTRCAAPEARSSVGSAGAIARSSPLHRWHQAARVMVASGRSAAPSIPVARNRLAAVVRSAAQMRPIAYAAVANGLRTLRVRRRSPDAIQPGKSHLWVSASRCSVARDRLSTPRQQQATAAPAEKRSRAARSATTRTSQIVGTQASHRLLHTSRNAAMATNVGGVAAMRRPSG